VNAHTQLRRRQISGLLIVAAVILIIALLRGDLHAIFPPGWWRF
jgi:hypothetical protein